MTSLVMIGVSVSVLPLGEQDEDALAELLALPAWPGCSLVEAIAAMPRPASSVRFDPSQNPTVRPPFQNCGELLIGTKADLCTLDARLGDGDTGSTPSAASPALVDGLHRMPLTDQIQLFRAIGPELCQTMGGSPGALLAIQLGAAQEASAAGKDIANSLKAG